LSFAGIPALVAGGVIAYLVLTAGSPVVAHVPVVNFSSSVAKASTLKPTAKGTKIVGDTSCIKAADGKRLPPLIHSDASPDHALVNELSMLRGASTTLDKTSLGSWDRYPLMIRTIFQRYARVFNGPEHVKVAYLPVTYCTQTEVAPSNRKHPGGIFRDAPKQGLVMLVLSNKGEHPPVLVGTAQQIKQGPALAGLGVDIRQGFSDAWLQTIVVPDGVSKVVMKFTPPFLHHYSNTVQIRSNVGIAVRHIDYEPTTVLWYGADGRLIKKFVDRKEIADDSCLAAHKKSCAASESTRSSRGDTTADYEVASNNKQAGSPALLAQANALYQPVEAFERSVTAAETASSKATLARVTRQTNACDAPYSRQLTGEVDQLWNDVSGLQQTQVRVTAIASQLRTLTSAWTALSLKNTAMDQFAHATASEMDATLNAAPISTCAFVRALAAHHFSYKWARQSSYGVEASDWWRLTLKYSNQASAFWRYVNPPTLYANTADVYRAGGAGWRLFTNAQHNALANLPGEAS
jgi:hypothetical protein